MYGRSPLAGGPASFFDFFMNDCFNFGALTQVIHIQHMMKPLVRSGLLYLVLVIISTTGFAQIPTFHAPLQLQDTTVKPDDTLRIRNLNPYFSLHVDSTPFLSAGDQPGPEQVLLFYERCSRRHEDQGERPADFPGGQILISFPARLKYDYEYKVKIGVQNLNNPRDRLDTSFTIVFYHRDHPFPCKTHRQQRPVLDEGDTISFRVQCETGTYPDRIHKFLFEYADQDNTNVDQGL